MGVMKSDGWMGILPDRRVLVSSSPAEWKPGEKHGVSNIFCDLKELFKFCTAKELNVHRRVEIKTNCTSLACYWNRGTLLVRADTDESDGRFARLRGLPLSFLLTTHKFEQLLHFFSQGTPRLSSQRHTWDCVHFFLMYWETLPAKPNVPLS